MRRLVGLGLLCSVCLFVGCGSKPAGEVDGLDGVDGVDGVDGGRRVVGKEVEPPEVELPEAPDPPRRPRPLEVPGFEPASHVGPSRTREWPMPVTVVLHGNFDRPEWECETWGETASHLGWVLCPRGVRTPWATREEDRWTYRGKGPVAREIEASIEALEARYPGRVSRERTILVGFSLGGILAPGLALDSPGRYPYLFLVEGGDRKLGGPALRRLKKAGVRGIGLAMSAPGRRSRARKLVGEIGKRNMAAVFVDMKGAGHAYSGDFTTVGRRALDELLSSGGGPDAGPGEGGAN